MTVTILDAMARGGFAEVVAIHDPASGLKAFLALHDPRRGPAFGGIRRWSYTDERRALLDCLRLSKAMTAKCALVGLEAGGGKVVVLDQPELDVTAAYRYLGDVVERMGGRFYTGPDVGTGARELGWVAERTEHVTKPGAEGPGQLAEATASGVFAGIGAALRHLDGAEHWSDRTIVVQGLGGVGEGLARRLVECGARVVAADIDEERARGVARALEIELVEPGEELGHECDVFSPCALGGVVHDLSIERLRARVVAGGANNVLARDEHGERLHERGVLYVPDVAINTGALLRGASFHLTGAALSLEEIEERVAAICARLLDLAAAEGSATARVAEREAERIVSEGVEDEAARQLETAAQSADAVR